MPYEEAGILKSNPIWNGTPQMQFGLPLRMSILLTHNETTIWTAGFGPCFHLGFHLGPEPCAGFPFLLSADKVCPKPEVGGLDW